MHISLCLVHVCQTRPVGCIKCATTVLIKHNYLSFPSASVCQA